MQRSGLDFLKDWLESETRKPLVLRGARQVGKTWLVRHLAEMSGRTLIEINFEKNPEHRSVFQTNHPRLIHINLEALLGKEIHPEQSLLFLDEIQVAPELLGKLRWFAEEYAVLPVIAAGSLLEFVLEKNDFSMPVGRIQYMHLEPLSFEEFLWAHQQHKLCEYLQQYDLEYPIPESLHQTLMQWFKEFLVIGGMPAAVWNWVQHRSPPKIHQIHSDLFATYRDDFSKYRGRLGINYLEEVMNSIPRFLGQRFVYSHVHPEWKSSVIQKTLSLLEKARLCHVVQACYGNGAPLKAELNEKYFKTVFLDIGLCNAALGLDLTHFQSVQSLDTVHRGGVAEQIVGQLLRTIEPSFIEPQLYYWLRHEKNSNAEIDYLITHGPDVIPIEVKSGKTGTLKSLHLFMQMKQLKLAVRLYGDLPHLTPINTQSHNQDPIQYQLLSLPFYLIGQLHRLLDLAQSNRGTAAKS